jgi:group I intron endonuclease
MYKSIIDISDYGVYEITRNDTGEIIYVGCSWKGVKTRFRKHISDLKGNRHPNFGLQRFWNSKGLTFTHVVSCLPVKKLTLAFEKAYGAQYDFSKLVNVNELGKEAPDCTGFKHTEEAKRKISEAKKGENHPFYGKNHSEESKKKMSEAKKGENHPFYGKNHSEESKKKISEGRKGTKHSEESKKKMSKATKGTKHSEETKKKMSEARKGENNYFYGKNHSEESKKKISEAKKGTKHSEESKKQISETLKGKNHCRYNVIDKCKEKVLFLYYNTDFTLDELGILFDCSRGTISRRLEEWG